MTINEALTCFYILSNIRPFPGGSRVMVRTSRCFAGTSFQFGGPDALVGVERFPCNLLFPDFFFSQFRFYSAPKVFVTCFHLEGASKFVLAPHDQKGEGAAGLSPPGRFPETIFRGGRNGGP